jgi:lipopolysaccharide assembly protein A
MRLITWLLRLALFLVMLGFALSNTESVALQFFGIPEFTWRAPLVLFLLLFFGAGALIGVASAIPTVFRQRRQLGRLRKDSARALADARSAAVHSEQALSHGVRESGIRGL